MDFTKKIIITIIVILLTYILWRLIKQRSEVKSNIEGLALSDFVPSIVPGLPSIDAEFKTIKDATTPISIKNINPEYADLSLKEYCIKGAYNSAWTGNYVNLDMISYVLSRGCRFLDFEVYYINKKNLMIPVIGVSNDPKSGSIINNSSILLDNALTTAVSSAFSSTSPNNNDPLFINLRIKATNTDVYHAVAKSVDYSLKNKLFKDKINKNTKLKNIMGKVVLLIDKTINYKYLDYAVCEEMDNQCYDLTSYTNLESGGELMNLYHYSEMNNQCSIPITISDNNLNTNVKKIKLLLPDMISNQKKNVYFNTLVYKYGFQIIPYIYYFKPTPDNELVNYEKFFNDNQSGIVLLSAAITYFKKLEQTQIQTVTL
jgi:hypothetical protein